MKHVAHKDIAAIMAAQTGAASSRNHIHNYLARIFSLAEIPLGLRPIGSSPVLSAYRAPADEGKHFNFLYPPEVLALLGNKAIPLGRRVLYLLSNYFGWRKGTLRAFKWSGITAGATERTRRLFATFDLPRSARARIMTRRRCSAQT